MNISLAHSALKSILSTRRSPSALDTRVEQGLTSLKEARRLVALRAYGPVLHQILARTYDLFDEIDEILLGLNPSIDHDAFAMVAALHRRFEEIQSLIPRSRRRSD